MISHIANLKINFTYLYRYKHHMEDHGILGASCDYSKVEITIQYNIL